MIVNIKNVIGYSKHHSSVRIELVHTQGTRCLAFCPASNNRWVNETAQCTVSGLVDLEYIKRTYPSVSWKVYDGKG